MEKLFMEEWIDRYLHGQMEPEERKDFESRCASDPSFAESVRLHAQAEYVSRQHARREKFHALNQEYERLKKAPGNIRPLTPIWMTAAAAVVLLLLGLLFFLRQETPPSDPQAVFMAYAEPYPLSSRRDTGASPWEAFSEAYARQDYAAATAAAESLLSDSSDARLWMYLGVSQLLNDQAEAALLSLHKVDSLSSFIEPARWYAALAYLKLGDLGTARSTLEAIADSDHYRRQQAAEMLRNLAP